MQIFNQNHSLFRQSNISLDEFEQFEKKIIELAHSMQLRLDRVEIDHIALRVNKRKSAEDWLTLLLKCGTILSGNIVNGRVIYLIQLDNPIRFSDQFIDIIELPFPKDKVYPVENWEHIEVIIPFEVNETVDEWVTRIRQQFLWEELANLKVKVSEPKVDGEQLPNPSIAVSFVNQLENHTCIKVHPYHIKKIIEG
ncbi:VOC family protein [Histophilus somni]|uniref:VOC family protein n=1 Tax=Histophilus somni TaxID=731 RepID=A0AAX2S5E8_HISSO|nr:VOC family protein [Histophilus somni]QEH08911.1 VOC family protein [Histophilus somni]QEH12507.1 VOC family protein [Histophilus somni]QEH25184.1 VOC family protein [Histophilus somni]QEH26990.1 VOC family protein [Histophilus somni]QEH51183.1 VOC family protein [Histophilus somni]